MPVHAKKVNAKTAHAKAAPTKKVQAKKVQAKAVQAKPAPAKPAKAAPARTAPAKVDHSKMKLGRKAIKTDSRTLMLGRYMTSALKPPPAACDWTKGITSWGMMLNGPEPTEPQFPNGLGDCTIAGAAHAIQVWTANNGSMVTVPDSSILNFYEQWDGYVPGEPNTDNGGVELDVLNDWQKNGFAGNPLLAFADPKASNLTEVRQAIALFGGVYIGMSLPLTAQTQQVWDVAPSGGAKAKPGSWGGHCVFVPKYDQKTFTCITWGGLQTMTVAFWTKYCDEAHALLSPAWIAAKGAPNGFNLAQLKADLQAIV
jgi:hypothetical protein